jgi:hypothetical protein
MSEIKAVCKCDKMECSTTRQIVVKGNDMVTGKEIKEEITINVNACSAKKKPHTVSITREAKNIEI